MFNASKSAEYSSSSSGQGGSATVIAIGVRVEGDFSSQGDVLIEGEMRGTLSASGRLTVGQEAVIVADVTAGDAIISGRVEGNLKAHRALEIKSTGQILGDITAEQISVESGAKISGRCSIGGKIEAQAGTTRRGAAPEIAAMKAKA